jgi:NUDIX domain
MGAGLLPITIHNGKIMFLFGKERDIDENPGWSDFGGGTDGKETFIETAIREGGEELTGFLGDSSSIRKLVHKYGMYDIDYKSTGYNIYRTHIFPMEYNHWLPHYYNNNQRFLQKRLPKKVIRDMKIFEKTQIQWFTFDEIKRRKKEFRVFYQNIVDLILTREQEIKQFVTKHLQRSKRSKTKKLLHQKKKNTTSRIK